MSLGQAKLPWVLGSWACRQVAEAELGMPLPAACVRAPTAVTLQVNGRELQPTEKKESCGLLKRTTEAALVERQRVPIS